MQRLSALNGTNLSSHALTATTTIAPVRELSDAVLLAPVYTTAIIVTGMVVALLVALRNTDSKHRADVIRAVAEVFRWFRRGGPPGGAR